MAHIGRHVLFELWGCNGDVDRPEAFRAAIPEIIAAIDATLLHLHVHRFSPQGVTGLAVLAESHLSLHSWPEHDYLAADVFTCGERVDPLRAGPVLQRLFEPAEMHVLEIERGADAANRGPARVRPNPVPSGGCGGGNPGA